MPPELAMGRGPVSDSTDGAAFRRRHKRAQYDVALFSSALPRSRRLLPMTGANGHSKAPGSNGREDRPAREQELLSTAYASAARTIPRPRPMFPAPFQS